MPDQFDPPEIREFYDPYPCIHGRVLPSPHLKISEAAHGLSGKRMSIGEVRNMLIGALEEGDRLGVDLAKNCIYLEVTYNDRPYDRGHTFILIKFR